MIATLRIAFVLAAFLILTLSLLPVQLVAPGVWPLGDAAPAALVASADVPCHRAKGLRQDLWLPDECL
jgi:hypothetical protein